MPETANTSQSGGPIDRLSPRARWLIGLAFAGIAARFALAFISYGTNDVPIWNYFAHFIRDRGVYEAYVTLVGPGTPVPVFNHPPLAGEYMAYAQAVAERIGLQFQIAIKLPGLLGELLVVFLLWRLHGGRARLDRASVAIAAFAWCLCSILVSGFHGNTDCSYAALCLLGVYLVQDRKAHFLGGLALAAATNIKLVPIFILPAIFFSYREWRPLLRFAGGLAIGVIPFLFPLFAVPRAFIRNVVSYTPAWDYWGLMGLAGSSVSNHAFSEHARRFLEWYPQGYRAFLFGPIVALAVYGGISRRWNLYQLTLLSLLTWFIVTPGFAAQYTVVLVPLAFAVDVSWAFLYGTLAGLYILTVYVTFNTHAWPLQSQFTSRFPMPAPLIGMLAWGIVIQFFVRVFRAGFRQPANRRSPESAGLETV